MSQPENSVFAFKRIQFREGLHRAFIVGLQIDMGAGRNMF